MSLSNGEDSWLHIQLDDQYINFSTEKALYYFTNLEELNWKEFKKKLENNQKKLVAKKGLKSKKC